MDVQAALDQMRTLLSLRPQSIYKTAYYRKQTKNHWSRDDPAFLVLQLIFLTLASFSYGIAFRAPISNGLSFWIASVVWNWLGLGICVATTTQYIADKYLQSHVNAGRTTHVQQNVEWLYAFDIHCNSFFPVFCVLCTYSYDLVAAGGCRRLDFASQENYSYESHLDFSSSSLMLSLVAVATDGLQFFTLPVVLGNGLVPLLLANTMYGAAFCWYWYITHLGYRSLPFLTNTEVFLLPMAPIGLLFASLVVLYPFGYGVNAAQFMAKFYFV
jgi:hypothetical protein